MRKSVADGARKARIHWAQIRIAVFDYDATSDTFKPSTAG